MRISALRGQSTLAWAQSIRMSVKALGLALLTISTMTVSAPPSFAADAGPLTVRVRQTGGAALNGATVCVQYQRVVRCGQKAPRTSNGIATVQNVPYGTVVVTISKAGFNTQKRKIRFSSGTPTQQFILSPVGFKPGPALTITRVSASGPATLGESPVVTITWQTNLPVSWQTVTNTPTVPAGIDWTYKKNQTEGEAGAFVRSLSGQPLVPGRLYRVYLHVRASQTSEIVTREVRIRYGQAPPPPVVPAQDYVVSGINSVAAVLELAEQRGFERAVTRMGRPNSPVAFCHWGRQGTRDSARMHTLYENKLGSLFIPQAECAFTFFSGSGSNLRLAPGWYIKDVKVGSVEAGDAPYCGNAVKVSTKPNPQSPRFVVKAVPSLPPRCIFVVHEITFRGPQHEEGWRGAFR